MILLTFFWLIYIIHVQNVLIVCVIVKGDSKLLVVRFEGNQNYMCIFYFLGGLVPLTPELLVNCILFKAIQ